MTPTDPWDRIAFRVGNLVQAPAVALVNETDPTGTSRRGIAGALHRAAGPELAAALAAAAPLAPGQAALTPGFRISGKQLIHVCPPRPAGDPPDLAGLAATYRTALRLARDEDLESLAFPALGLGPDGFAPADGARVALEEVAAWLGREAAPSAVFFCFFRQAEARAFEQAVASLA